MPTIDKVEGCINKYFGSRDAAVGATASGTVGASNNASILTHVVHRHPESIDLDSLTGKRGAEFVFTQTIGAQVDTGKTHATTYNCLRSGGERIIITGSNFGTAEMEEPSSADLTPTVTIGGATCRDVAITRDQEEITCTLPPGHAAPAAVVVRNSAMPGLFDSKPFLAYAKANPQVTGVVISNVAARAMDVSWNAPADYWDALTATGYKIDVTATSGPGALLDVVSHTVYVGNVSHTTLIGLEANTVYSITVSAMTEDQDVTPCMIGGGSVAPTDPSAASLPPSGGPPFTHHSSGFPRCLGADGETSSSRTLRAWRRLDLYGRRGKVAMDSIEPWLAAHKTLSSVYRTREMTTPLIGTASVPVVAHTLGEDFRFTLFNANATVNHGATNGASSLGPTGMVGGEGHYGLYLVGEANVENGNITHACCDGYDGTSQSSCGTLYSAISSVQPSPTYDAKLSNANGYNRGHAGSINVTTNAIDGGAKIYVGSASGYAHQATLPCGPALRLTAGHARSSGAAWYRRMQNVREGFDTTFTFRISSPSTQCRFLHDEYTHCRSRGADGFAFVVEAQHAQALGGGFSAERFSAELSISLSGNS